MFCDPRNHPINEATGDDGSAWFGGNQSTAETFADPSMVTHENYVTKFTVDNEFFEVARSHPDWYEDIYGLDGKIVHEISIPHDLIDLFNRHTVSRGAP